MAGIVLVAAIASAPVAAAAAPKTLTAQQAVDQGVAAAADDGVNQYVALVDRKTGKLVASAAETPK